MLSLLLAVVAQAHADCAADLSSAIARVEAAFAAQATSGAVEAVAAMDAAIGCVAAPVTPRTAARVHRAHALVAHLSGGATLDHLHAMRRADPWLVWDLAPADHPLTIQLYAVEEGVQPSLRPLPTRTDWRVDGLAVPVVPSRLPVLVQVVEQGRVAESWVGPGDKVSVRRERAAGGRTPWNVAGVASAALAAGLYGGAWAAHSTYQRSVEVGDDPRTLRMHGVTNSLTVGSLGAAGAAATLLAVGFTR